jgi:hypothetical protein
VIFEHPSEQNIRERRAAAEAIAETLGSDGFEQRALWLVSVASAVDEAAVHNLHFSC